MSLPVLPNPSNLVAVALVVNRTRDGASLVFHYPPEASLDRTAPNPGSPGSHFARGDMILERLSTGPSQPQGQGLHAGPGGLDERLAQGSSGGADAPWESVTGFPDGDLASLMSPGRRYHRTLFQVSLDPLHYVSCPVHVPENGIWRKKKDQLNPKSKMHSSVNLHELESNAKAGNDDPPKEDPGHHADETPDGKGAPGDEAEKEDKNEKGEKVSSMTMFNVVFILNPKQHEARELVSGLYSNIMKKVNKAYKYCQQHSDFVWKESKRIIRMKEKAKEDSKSTCITYSCFRDSARACN